MVMVGDVEIGNGVPVIMSGPCVVSDVEQLVKAAEAVKAAGATMLRGGAFKPRTSSLFVPGTG